MMNNDSDIAKTYLDLLTHAKYCRYSRYSNEDNKEVKQFKDNLYLTELKKILKDAEKKSNNKTLLAFLQNYYDYLNNIKDQTLRNSDYDNSFTRHKNLMLFKLEQHEDAQSFGVQLNFDDVWNNNFSFASLPDKSKQQFGQQYKEKYKTLLFISLTTTVCAIAGFTAAVCLLAILNPASIWFIPLLVVVIEALVLLGVFSAIASMECAYNIHNINSYQQNCKKTPLNIPEPKNTDAKTDQKNKDLLVFSNGVKLGTEDDAALDLAWNPTQ